MKAETKEQKERKEQAFRRGVADALNGTEIREIGRNGYKNQYEKLAYDEGYLEGSRKKKSYAEGGEDD